MAISISEARKRFEDSGFSRANRYEEGAKNKGGAWKASGARAKENYKPAMAEALAKGLYDKGMDAADAGSYDQGVLNKGVPNWGTGMSAGGASFEKNTGKFATIWGQSLPTPGGPRRSAANLKRMTENVTRFITAAGK